MLTLIDVARSTVDVLFTAGGLFAALSLTQVRDNQDAGSARVDQCGEGRGT